MQQVDDDHLVVKSGEEGEFCGDDLDSSCKVSGFDFDLLPLTCSLKIDLSGVWSPGTRLRDLDFPGDLCDARVCA